MTPAQTIREKIFCSNCKNCKLMVWGEDFSLQTNSKKTPYLSEFEGNVFLVRCSWLKENVLYPLQLLKCEGFDKKEG